MRGLVLGMVVVLGVGIADAKPCHKGTSRIGKKCVIDRWPTSPVSATPRKLRPIIISPRRLAALRSQPKLRYANLLDDNTLPVEGKPTAGAIYHAAQAYRQAGDRTQALDLYEQYLIVAPTGPAAPAVRAQIEKLRADVE